MATPAELAEQQYYFERPGIPEAVYNAATGEYDAGAPPAQQIPPQVMAAASGLNYTPDGGSSELNYTPAQQPRDPTQFYPVGPAQPAQQASEQVPPEAQQAPPPEPNTPMANYLLGAMRNTQSVVPGGQRRIQRDIVQEIPTAMPGTDDVPTVPGRITTGNYPVDPAVLASLNAPRGQELDASVVQQPIPDGINPQAWAEMSPEEQRKFSEYLGEPISIAQRPYVDQVKDYSRRLDASPPPQSFSPTGEPLRPETEYARRVREFNEQADATRAGQEGIAGQELHDRQMELQRLVIQNRKLGIREAEIADEQERRRLFMAENLPKLERLMDSRVKIESKNPAKDYWGSMGTGERIVTAIALAMSTLGSGLTGAPNVVMDMINQEINGEVLKQRQTTETLGLKYMQGRQLYADMLSQFRTPESAENAVRYIELSRAENLLRQEGAKQSGREAQAKYNALADQAAQQAVAAKRASLEGVMRTGYQDVPAKVVGSPGGVRGLVQQLIKDGVPRKDALPIAQKLVDESPNAAARSLGQKEMTRPQIEALKHEQGARIVLPDMIAARYGTKEVWATDAEQKKEAQKGLRGANATLASIAQLRQIAVTGNRLSPTDRAIVDQISARSIGAWRVELGLGVMSDSDKELVKPLTGAFVKEVSVRDRIRMLDNVESMVNRTIGEFMGEVYKDPQKTQFAQTPTRERAVK